MTVIHTTYQRRGYLTKAGYAQLDYVLRQCAVLYNAGLEEWRSAYKMAGKTVTYYDQLKEFTGVRADNEHWGSLDLNVGRGVLKRLERAKKAFFRRCKAGETPGYPYWASGWRWRTIEMAAVRPAMVRGHRVKIKGLPEIRMKGTSLPDSNQLKGLRITRQGRRVTVSLGYAVDRAPLPYNPDCVGIDMGITDRMTLSSGAIMLAGVDVPAAGLDPAEIPTFGDPILGIPAEGVAPDAGESTIVTLRSTQDLAVAPDAGESTPSGDASRSVELVAPDAGESTPASTPYPAPTGVAPDAGESTYAVSFPWRDVGVAPDAGESTYESRPGQSDGRVAPDAGESTQERDEHDCHHVVAPDAGESTYKSRWVASGGSVAPDAEESPGHATSIPATMPRRVDDRHNLVKTQRRMDRCKKGSRERRNRARILANARNRERVRTRNACHRTTTAIIQSYGHIGVESLKIANMTRSAAGTQEKPGTNVAAKSGLNREILAQTWGEIHRQLKYKAEWAGRQFVEVDPKNTSRTCSQCGAIDAASRYGKDFRCVACGYESDADLNAAKNILRKSLVGGDALPPVNEPAGVSPNEMASR